MRTRSSGATSVDTHKPDRSRCSRRSSGSAASRSRALFVGDSRRDAVAAERAGVPFAWAADLIER
ncbi:HAD hydrolase-like protein [Halorubrum saccharovorum]|uniref:HAD hydrolase-like protein n=1 Tax=Halorubrum saccharovorum TaxID=2248 RepID=UPI00128ADE89